MGERIGWRELLLVRQDGFRKAVNRASREKRKEGREKLKLAAKRAARRTKRKQKRDVMKRGSQAEKRKGGHGRVKEVS